MVISRIYGRLVEIRGNRATLFIGWFDASLLLSPWASEQLEEKIGSDVVLLSRLFFKGDLKQGRIEPTLLGFHSELERDLHESLCTVDGIRELTALKMITTDPDEIVNWIRSGNDYALKTLPGVGPASATRIVATLENKLAKLITR